MTTLKRMLCATGLFLLASCTQNEFEVIDDVMPVEQNHIRSIEDAVSDVLDCVKVLYPDELITKAETFEVSDVTAIYEPTTKGSNNKSSNPALYKVNFQGGGSAYASADDRAPSVLAVMEEVPEDDSIDDFLLNQLFFVAKQVRNEDGDVISVTGLKDGQNKDHSRFIDKTRKVTKSVGPIINAKWGGINNELEKMCPNGRAGCGPIAVGQLMTFFKYPKSVSWEKKTVKLDWESICLCNKYSGVEKVDLPKENSLFNHLKDNSFRFGGLGIDWPLDIQKKMGVDKIIEIEKQVATLLRWLGDQMDAHYITDSAHLSTGTTPNNVKKWFANHNYNVSGWSKFKESKAIEHLDKGYPFIAGGAGDSSEGHFWTIDGYKIYYSVFYGFETMMHCNWGWGGYCNGYFLTNNFNTSTGWCITDDGDIREFNHSIDDEHYTDVDMLLVSR